MTVMTKKDTATRIGFGSIEELMNDPRVIDYVRSIYNSTYQGSREEIMLWVGEVAGFHNNRLTLGFFKGELESDREALAKDLLMLAALYTYFDDKGNAKWVETVKTWVGDMFTTHTGWTL